MTMKRHIIIPALAGMAVVVVPSVASATMAYVSVPARVGGASYAMLANDNGSNPVRVAKAVSVAISPDGTRLAYQAGPFTNGPTLLVRDIASGATASAGTTCLSAFITWSPDSKWLACMTEATTAKGIVTGDGLGLLAVPAVVSAGGTLTVPNFIAPVGNAVGYSVAFSPDSTRIAFSLDRFNPTAAAGTLFVAPVNDAAARTAVFPRAGGAVWGASGIAVTQLHFASVRLGSSRTRTRIIHTQVWTVNPDGTNARRLTKFRATGFMSGPSAALWAPGGERIIGSIGGQDVSNVATFAVPSGVARTLTSTSISNPVAVTPDGQRVLYEADMDGDNPSVRLIGVNGTGKRVLVRGARNPSVTADWNA